jgi:hypothetical protein
MNDTGKNRTRNWRAVSIRELLLLMTIVAIYLSFVVNRDNVRRSAAKRIAPYGGFVSWNENGPRFLTKLIGRDLYATPQEIFFAREPLPDDALELLSGLETAERFSIAHNATFSGSGLQYLKNFHNLKLIRICNVPITDRGLSHLPELRSLDRLEIIATEITNDSLPQLRQMDHLSVLVLGSKHLGRQQSTELRQSLPKTTIIIDQRPFSFEH